MWPFVLLLFSIRFQVTICRFSCSLCYTHALKSLCSGFLWPHVAITKASNKNEVANDALRWLCCSVCLIATADASIYMYKVSTTSRRNSADAQLHFRNTVMTTVICVHLSLWLPRASNCPRCLPFSCFLQLSSYYAHAYVVLLFFNSQGSFVLLRYFCTSYFICASCWRYSYGQLQLVVSNLFIFLQLSLHIVPICKVHNLALNFSYFDVKALKCGEGRKSINRRKMFSKFNKICEFNAFKVHIKCYFMVLLSLKVYVP